MAERTRTNGKVTTFKLSDPNAIGQFLSTHRKNLIALDCAPHPDDDVIGAGSLKLRADRLPVTFVVAAMTFGNPGDEEIRGPEQIECAKRLGKVSGIVYPDLSLLHKMRPVLGRMEPKFRIPTAEDQPQFTESLAKAKELLRLLRPSAVITPHRFDEHDDHKATYYLMRRAIPEIAAELITPIRMINYWVWTYFLCDENHPDNNRPNLLHENRGLGPL